VSAAIDDQYRDSQEIAETENWPHSLPELLESMVTCNPVRAVNQFNYANPTFNLDLDSLKSQKPLLALEATLNMIMNSDRWKPTTDVAVDRLRMERNTVNRIAM
jgi:hypothetical protein